MSKEVDIYRDTPVRYLGYSNELGESFRHYIGHKAVLATYGVATCYVLADTIDKTRKMYKLTASRPNQCAKTSFIAADTFIWQILASVAIPGFTINRVCRLSSYALSKFTNFKLAHRNIMVTTIGIGVIPFIIHPIDSFVDMFLNSTLRKLTPD